jgi:hypothetical protein
MTLFLLPIAQTAAAPQAARAATPNLSIFTTNVIGNPLPGYYTTVSEDGLVLQRGYSPASFTLSPGQYQVAVSDYGGYFFDRWNDSVTSRVQTVTITTTNTISLTALYFTSPSTAPNFAMASSPATITLAAGATAVSGLTFASVNGFSSALSLRAATNSSVSIRASFAPSSLKLGALGTATATMTITVAANATLGTYPLTVTAVGGNVSNSITLPLSVSKPAPADGITVYADRVPASYWAPCFATTCALGTGPGAAMWVVLYSSSGSVVQTGFANENGYTFTGLNPGATYYVYPSDCDNCHGSTHDVLFSYWGDNISSTTRPLAVIVGTSVDAWYICTNGCSGV